MSETSSRPSRMLHGTATSSAPFRPPSSAIPVSQDCAFPPFPTNKSRSATPTTPSDPARTFTADGPSLQHQLAKNDLYTPSSPQGKDSSILQRMDSIAPGPFNTSFNAQQDFSTHHRRTTTTSTKDSVRYSSSSNGSSHSRRPSTAATTRSRHPSLSSIAGGPRSTVQRIMADSPTLPTMPPFSKDLSCSPERIQTRDSIRPVEALNQVGRSHTHPLEGGYGSESPGKRAAVVRRPSEPAVAAAMKPLDQIGSTSTFKSLRSQKDRKTLTATATVSTEVFDQDAKILNGSDARLQNVPSMPEPPRVQDFAHMNPYHTPTESNSSNESSGSDSRSVSSRSTPPLTGSPHRGKRRPSEAGHIDTLLQDFRFGTEHVSVIEEPIAPLRVVQPSFSRPMYARPPDALPSLQEPVTWSPDSPTDPAIKSARPIPVQAPSDYNAPILPLQNGHLRLSPAPPPPPAVPVSPARKSTTVNKGKCRGCGELIKGKSVSSADGRLTGRYHRSCFVCKTCREPFQTADFYVLDNHPFCARHYHELNESLCRTCDRGIEGQYLETELKQKFHPYCFTCQVSASLPALPHASVLTRRL
ncbi:MAG: hypothetical protein Q9210_007109 [Variospora velana]